MKNDLQWPTNNRLQEPSTSQVPVCKTQCKLLRSVPLRRDWQKLTCNTLFSTMKVKSAGHESTQNVEQNAHTPKKDKKNNIYFYHKN